MVKNCPNELKWIRQVGDGCGCVPLHEAKIKSAENILNPGRFRREMYREALENFRIPTEDIEEFADKKLGRGGQADVYQGKRKLWNGRVVDVAIKKWGHDGKKKSKRKRVKNELAKYQNEVKVLIQLRKHR